MPDRPGTAKTGKLHSRVVLMEASASREALGHENRGFLSESRGFMPVVEPLLRLPSDFSAWDEAARELPRLYSSLGLRRTLDSLPLLSADEGRLPDWALLRAASVLSILVHAYHYVETRPPERVPSALLEPWAEVRRRLGRQDAALNYIDLIVYNYRLLDPTAQEPFRLENMRLLTPTVDTPEERTFYLTQTEILARTGPIVGAVVRAQEAVAAGDAPSLKSEIWTIIDCLQGVVRHSLPKIDPNPAGATFVDPVVWAKTVAPFAVPTQKGVQGPSGTSSPLFNLLDEFFGRKQHKSFLGREIRGLRTTYPLFWQQFLAAVAELRVEPFLAQTRDPELSGLWDQAIETYVGENGFLGRHRMKVYGYLELAFKVGRSLTIGGFSGLFKDRTWDQVDAELEYSRIERLQSFPHSCHHGKLELSGAEPYRTSSLVRQVALSVDGSGIRYEPGDRCGILAENGDELVTRTLAALDATGLEHVELTPEWRDHLRLRPGYEQRDRLSLEELLRFGVIRPVVPRVAEALHAVTQDRSLRDSILDQSTTRWELWDLLLHLRAAGFDTRQLWQAPPDSTGYVGRVVPPENFRMYSISSAMRANERTATMVELTVGLVRYRTPSSRSPELERSGTASSFLANSAGREKPVPFLIEHPPRFSLPEDPHAPLVMIAGGTGIAPFLSFIRRRAERRNVGPAWLFWGLRSREYFGCRDELAQAVGSGALHLEVAFSREESSVVFVPGTHGSGGFEFMPGPRRRVMDCLRQPDTRRMLFELLTSSREGGQGAFVYLCGRSRFARAVDDTLREVIASGLSLSHADHHDVDDRITQMTAEKRYLREVYTDPRSEEGLERRFDVSEIVTKNQPDSGYWLVIDARVYDITPFVRVHPGGTQVLLGYAGMDATQGYLRAHPRATEVNAMREMYAIGKVRQLDFRQVSRVVERRDVTVTMSIAALHRAWVSYTYLAVEMQNALRGDLSLQACVTARGDPVSPRSSYKLERAIETQERFLKSYASFLIGAPATELWELAEGMCRGRPSDFMERELLRLRQSQGAHFVDALCSELRANLAQIVAAEWAPGSAEPTPSRARVIRACEVLEGEALRFLSEIKAILREGLVLFERYESSVLEMAGEELLKLLALLPDVLASYCDKARARLEPLGWHPMFRAESMVTSEPPRASTRLVASTPYWLMEVDGARDIVFLRRSAAPIASLADLVSQNDRIIAQISRNPGGSGIVVDMRQAPGRNDTDFEQAMRRLRTEVSANYSRVAVLLVSAAGVLQVTRLGRDDNAKTLVTLSEEAAVAFAMGRT